MDLAFNALTITALCANTSIAVTVNTPAPAGMALAYGVSILIAQSSRMRRGAETMRKDGDVGRWNE